MTSACTLKYLCIHCRTGLFSLTWSMACRNTQTTVGDEWLSHVECFHQTPDIPPLGRKWNISYLKFLMVPFLTFPLSSEGTCGAVATSILWMVGPCMCVHTCVVYASVHFRHVCAAKRMTVGNSCSHLCQVWSLVSSSTFHPTLVFLLSVSLPWCLFLSPLLSHRTLAQMP